MHIDVITLFPDLFKPLQELGVLGRAVSNELIKLGFYNPRDFAHNKHQNVDDRPFGGGPGMVMQYQPLAEAVLASRTSGNTGPVCYLSPQGRRLDQSLIKELSSESQLILVCGRYEGVDERFVEDYVQLEISIGDYVLSGGELAAMVLIDGLSRLLPGVLGHEDSAEQDSFVNGLLDCPHYTRPEEVAGKSVPKVLTSGDHQAIARWRLKQSLGRTWQRRPDLLETRQLSVQELELLNEFKLEQNS